MTKKLVLAFSGGLDTSYCAKYLSEDLGYEVHAVTVNTGGFTSAELKKIAQRATDLGVSSYKAIDKTKDYYEKGIKFLLFGNVLKNNTYPLSVSAERVFQAVAIAEFAKEVNADAVAHGSTGAGNDQVRFDMIFNTICPKIEIITPIRDQKLSREAEIEYLKQKGVNDDWAKAAYSINQGLWGTSVGGKETLISHGYLPEEAYPYQLQQGITPTTLKIAFAKGQPVGLNGKTMQPAELIAALDIFANEYAIGRDTHVGDTIIGIKGRVGFVAAAATILIKAHHLLEKHVLTKHQLIIKDQISITYGNLVHEGHFLEPALRDIEALLEHSQEKVTGEVEVYLAPYRFQVLGIKSPNDLMNSKFGSYGEMNLGWSGEDVKGFAKIFGNQSKMYSQLHNDK
jgi:argininosuccinate synthase